MGAYQQGSNPEVDEAIEFYPGMMQFLQQNFNEAIDFDSSLQKLMSISQSMLLLAEV